MAYDNTNSGALFENDRKTKSNHPDYRGTLDVEGTEYWMSAWVKTSRSGDQYISIALTPKEEESGNGNVAVNRINTKASSPAPLKQGNGPSEDANGMDEIPF